MTDPRPPRSFLGWLPPLFARVLFPGPVDPDARVRPACLLVVLALPAALLYPTLGFHLLEPDEGRYAQIPREMHESGGWVVPTLQGLPYLDKPPLMYWLVAASYSAFGVSPAAARLVPAVCVHLTVLAVYLLGRRSVGERGAFWAAVLLAVAPGFVGVARLLLLDGLLVLCVTVSVLCGFEAVRAGRLRLGWWVASAAASGLGFLTKGPIAEVLLFVPLWLYGWLAGRQWGVGSGEWAVEKEASRGGSPRPARASGAVGGASGLLPTPHSPLPTVPPARPSLAHYLLFGLIVVGVSLPWYVAMYLREPAFLRHFFWEHNVLRFAQPFDHLQPVWYYAPLLAGGLLPGTVLLGVLLAKLLRGDPAAADRPSPHGGFWLLAGLWGVFFFSCSGSKLPTYILPAYPFLCLAVGEFVARSRWDRAASTRAGVVLAGALVAAVHHLGLPWYAEERSPYGRPELVGRFVADRDTAVVCFPRNCDSLAFYAGRSDLRKVRTRDVNQLMVDCHHRPRTVILFTHRDSLAGFRNTLPPSLEIVETVSLRREYDSRLLNTVFGSTPWGLCDVAVVVPKGR